jgi:hypothetical protein
MSRHIDPRLERERPDMGRGGTGDLGGRSLDTEDVRDVFSRDLDLPRGLDRERVRGSSRDYDLRGSEVRVLATAGAFRVVDLDDLGARSDSAETLRRDIQHLRDQGLIDDMTTVVGRDRTKLVTLTDEGLRLLEAAQRDPDRVGRQAFHAGVAHRREIAHDSRVYRAYLRAAERVREEGGQIRRIVLENDLKSQYQSFLQERNAGRRDSTGRPDRDAREIARWATEHHLPQTDDGRVQFPDVRIEIEEREGTFSVRDLEVVTPNYRGAHAAAKAQSGFARYRTGGGRVGGRGSGGGIGGRSGSGRGGRPRESRLAEEMLE